MPGRDSGIDLDSPTNVDLRRRRRIQRRRDHLNEALSSPLFLVPEEVAMDADGNPILQPAGGANAAAGAAAANDRQHFRVPPYSGHVVGTTYTGTMGQVREVYSVKDWVKRVEIIAGANSWDQEKTARCAQLMLQPGTPAGVWYLNHGEDACMARWNLLKPELLREFATFINASDKVDILRSFSQKPSEMVHHYLNRIQVDYKRFHADLEFDGPHFGAAETAVETAHRERVTKVILDFHMANFFCLGLRDEYLRDVTKSNARTLDAMVQTARFSEQAQLQGRGRHTISAVEVQSPNHSTPPEAGGLSSEEIAFIRSMRAGAASGGGGGGNKGKGRGKGKGKGDPNVTCFFCLITGHKANECRKRIAERAEGKFRKTINDAVLSKDEFDRLPTGARTKEGTSYAAATVNAAGPTVGPIEAHHDEMAYQAYLASRSSN